MRWGVAIGTALIAAWVGFRIVLVWDHYIRDLPEHWGRKPYWIASLVAAIGWIAYFQIAL